MRTFFAAHFAAVVLRKWRNVKYLLFFITANRDEVEDLKWEHHKLVELAARYKERFGDIGM